MTLQGKTAIQAFDGETAWMLWPLQPFRSSEPTVMPDHWAAEFEPDAHRISSPHKMWGSPSGRACATTWLEVSAIVAAPR